MLCVDSYPPETIGKPHSHVESQLRAYDSLVSKSGKGAAFTAVIANFEPLFFNERGVVLEGSFMHNCHVQKPRHGSPANEAGMIAKSILTNNTVLAADKTIRYQPSKSVTGLGISDEIKLTAPSSLRFPRPFSPKSKSSF